MGKNNDAQGGNSRAKRNACMSQKLGGGKLKGLTKEERIAKFSAAATECKEESD